MSVSTEVSRQWATRPDDERFLSVAELYESVKGRRDRSTQHQAALDMLEVKADNETVYLRNPETGEDSALNHWSFNQLSSLVKAPAKYLRTLPPQLAAINLQTTISQIDRSDLSLLQTQTPHGPQMRSVNGSKYGRIWDEELVSLVMKHVDLDVWKIPSASYAHTNPKLATTLYASDRDCFMFLVNEENPVEVPGNGGRDTLFRGVIIGNSETGSSSLFKKEFLYRTVCDNRMIWGMRDESITRIVHSAGAPHRFARELAPSLAASLSAGSSDTVKVITAARDLEVGKTPKQVTDWMTSKGGFAATLTRAAMQRAEEEEGNPYTLWNLIQGVTSLAKDQKHQNTRLTMEAKASKLMKYAEARV